AARIQKGVWNQNVAPFLLVATDKDYRLYSGFKYESEPAERKPLKVVLKTARAALQAFDDFSAAAIDEGRTWHEWREHVTPSGRVDWSLLRNLEALSVWLRSQGLKKDVAHSLIGKYVYLHYLRDRDILSSRKFDGWGIE